MTPDEFRNRLLAISAAAADAVVLLFRMLPADPSDQQWAAFTELAYAPILQARFNAFELSREFYLSQRPVSTTSAPPEFAERPYSQRVVEKVLRPSRARLVGVDELEAEERRIAEAELRATLGRHVAAAGRDGVTDASKNDPIALGYARVPSGAETCAFCTMLVSRGPVYKSESTAKERANGEPYHNHCDCVVVPVFDRKNWPGRDDYLAAQRLWRDVTSGYSGDDALNALRRHLYAA